MGERTSLFQVGSTMGTGDIPGENDPTNPRTTVREWERVMWKRVHSAGEKIHLHSLNGLGYSGCADGVNARQETFARRSMRRAGTRRRL
jgi:hypothetical protein